MLAVIQRVRYIRSVVGGVLILGVAATPGVAQAAGEGDQFHVGDRIVLTVEGTTIIADTFVVQEGGLVRLPAIGDISLKGVHRSDATAYLTQQIGRHLRNPVVHVVPLIRVALSGAVSRPGYYSIRSDMLLSDVIMQIGRPTQEADLGKTVIRRDGRDIIGASRVNAGLTAGKTLDDMLIAPGDEIAVGERSRQTNHLDTLLRITYLLTGLTGLAFSLAHR